MPGHRWIQNNGEPAAAGKVRPRYSDREDMETLPYSEQIDIFRVDAGYHNGPECWDCLRRACEHCEPGIYEEECDGGR